VGERTNGQLKNHKSKERTALGRGTTKVKRDSVNKIRQKSARGPEEGEGPPAQKKTELQEPSEFKKGTRRRKWRPRTTI